MALKTIRWDTADYLKTREDIAGYLDAALEDGDSELLKLALGNVARSKGMTEIAKESGIRRPSLYKALSPDGNPEFATVVNVLKALGLRLSVAIEQTDRRRGADSALRAAAAKSRSPAVKSTGPRPPRDVAAKRTKRP
jgi:probable addiction module antidote protein